MCNCNGKSTPGVTYRYLVTKPNGEQQTYNTEIEARAALTRLGGGAIQKVATR